MQGQLELVLASAGVAELEEVNKVILLLPLYSVVACSLYPCSLFVHSRCPLSRCSLCFAYALCLLVLFFVMLLATCVFRADSGRLPGGNSGGVRERCGGL